jgi:hypothetical protein
MWEYQLLLLLLLLLLVVVVVVVDWLGWSGFSCLRIGAGGGLL